MSLDDKIDDAGYILKDAIEQVRPKYILSMVSGGKDSLVSDALLREFGIDVYGVVHCNTRTGIPETFEYVKEQWGNSDLIVADAGDAYERYVMRKGFFGVGKQAHGFSYRVLKADPMRKAISRWVRMRKHGIRILMVSGVRKAESRARRLYAQSMRPDPGQKQNVWVSPLLNWTQEDRDAYIESRGLVVNPVAKALCCSGECMCGTMQTRAHRIEASILYPEWGAWLDDLEWRVYQKHGVCWGDHLPHQYNYDKTERFQPMCVDCKGE